MFSMNMQNVLKWTGSNESHCGIVNINICTSAEIGGALCVEKETWGDGESGGDDWYNIRLIIIN